MEVICIQIRMGMRNKAKVRWLSRVVFASPDDWSSNKNFAFSWVLSFMVLFRPFSKNSFVGFLGKMRVTVTLHAPLQH